MQIKTKLTVSEIKQLVIPELANRFGVPNYDIEVDIELPVTPGGLNATHKIAMIKFMRTVIQDFVEGRIKLPDDESGGQNPPKTIGLMTSKLYVEKYLGQ